MAFMASIAGATGLGIAFSSGSSSSDALKRGLGRATVGGSYLSPPVSVAVRPKRAGLGTVVVRAAEGINPDIRKTEDKVVDSVVVTELSKPLTAYCRCWRSGTFPLCDGSHVKHNKATGDNVGPLLLKKQ